MKKFYILFALIFLGNQLINAQTVNVTFRVTLKGTGKKLHPGGLRITGGLNSTDQPDWNPGSAKQMTIGTTTADSVYSVTLKVPRPASDSVLFKFINGDNWGDGSGTNPEDERGLGAPCAQASGDKNRILKFRAGLTDTTLPIYVFNSCTVVGAPPAPINITFRVTLKGTGKKLHPGGLRVTGALGSPDQPDWNPGSALKMTLGTPASDSVYSVTLRVPRPTGDSILYKFINGDNWGDGSGTNPEDERGLGAPCAQPSGDKNRIYKIPAGATNITLPIYNFNTCTIVEPGIVNVTFRVTLKGTGKKLHPGGLRVTGALGSPDQPDWNPGSAKLMTIGTPIADSIYYVTLKVARPANDTIQYKFINGDNWGDGANGATEDERALVSPCANADKNRIFKLPAAVTAATIPVYRFNTCTTVTTSTRELETAKKVVLAPNPTADYSVMTFDNPTSAIHSIDVFNIMGQAVKSLPAHNGESFIIEKGNLVKGMYFVKLQNKEGQSLTRKLVIE